jgi:hypothetical protein
MIALGTYVQFKPEMFLPPNTPWYDGYEGHVFEVIGYMPNQGIEFDLSSPELKGTPFDHGDVVYDHISLKCVTGDVVVRGYVHDWDVIQVP